MQPGARFENLQPGYSLPIKRAPGLVPLIGHVDPTVDFQRPVGTQIGSNHQRDPQLASPGREKVAVKITETQRQKPSG